MKQCWQLLITLTTITILQLQPAAVTQKLTSGRFGDQLLNYLHIKWLSYKFGVECRPRPFKGCYDLVLGHKERMLSSTKHFVGTTTFGTGQNLYINPLVNVLYEIPYFPEGHDELTRKKDSIFKFDINWDDPIFIANIQAMITPAKPVQLVQLIPGTINIALHVRRGSGRDNTTDTHKKGSQNRTDINRPEKFAGDIFFLDQLFNLSKLFANQQLSVYLFTDHPKPQILINQYRSALRDPNIKIYDHVDSTDDGLLRDFFSLARFDVIVRPDSNFSIVAAHVGQPVLEIWPEWCSFTENKWAYKSAEIRLRYNEKSLTTTWQEFGQKTDVFTSITAAINQRITHAITA